MWLKQWKNNKNNLWLLLVAHMTCNYYCYFHSQIDYRVLRLRPEVLSQYLCPFGERYVSGVLDGKCWAQHLSSFDWTVSSSSTPIFCSVFLSILFHSSCRCTIHSPRMHRSPVYTMGRERWMEKILFFNCISLSLIVCILVWVCTFVCTRHRLLGGV